MSMPTHFPHEPALLWNYFHHITTIPRPSKHEEKMREFILSAAQKMGLKTNTDSVGNVIVYIPATVGYEAHPPVIIQNHMDMVTDHAPSRQINFMTDPILTTRDGEWLTAQGTTLGADNGIGCAAALALMEAKDVKHPPLELLFTVDEETGLKGAWGVEPSLLKGQRMINLDTEEWGSFYIGCAGGIDYELEGKLGNALPTFATHTFKLTVGGFLGGHSGVDIHEQRGNAIKFLTEVLAEVDVNEVVVQEIRGGKAHNIIPRDAFAVVAGGQNLAVKLNAAAETVTKRWQSFQPVNDKTFQATVTSVTKSNDVGLTGTELTKLLSFLLAFPHGAHKYDAASGGELVALSNNLAIVLFVRGQFYTQTSLRFFDRAECVSLERQVESLGRLMALEIKKNGEYPSWKPVRENALLDLMTETYQQVFAKKPKVTAIHAGLECGILRDKIGPIDAVSFGPTITGAHSPDERVNIPTVEQFWKLLVNVLERL